LERINPVMSGAHSFSRGQKRNAFAPRMLILACSEIFCSLILATPSGQQVPLCG
jgi:hypothetical protein